MAMTQRDNPLVTRLDAEPPQLHELDMMCARPLSADKATETSDMRQIALIPDSRFCPDSGGLLPKQDDLS
jgi:hypothetical protein